VRDGEGTDLEGRLKERIAAEGGEVTRLRIIQPQLEDVFISLLEG
jgi:hypothetical protein